MSRRLESHYPQVCGIIVRNALQYISKRYTMLVPLESTPRYLINERPKRHEWSDDLAAVA